MNVWAQAVYPFFRNQLLAEGYTVEWYPGEVWNTNEPKSKYDRTVSLNREVKSWLAKPDNIFIDAWSDHPEINAYCRRTGRPYFGATPMAYAWENDRRAARRLLRAHKLPQGKFYAVDASNKDKIFEQCLMDWKLKGRLYVIKADYEMSPEQDYFNVIVPETFEEFAWAYHEHFQYPLSLEERFTGIEVAFTTIVVDDMILPLHTNFEHKRTHAGNLGVNAGEVGTLIVQGVEPRVMETLFVPLHEVIKRSGFRGYLDLNCIYDPEKDRLTVLEFTPRFGSPTHQIWSEMVERPASLILEWAQNEPAIPQWKHPVAVGLLMVPSGFPFAHACRQKIPCKLGPFQHAHWHTMSLRQHDSWGHMVSGGRQGVLAVGGSTVEEARTKLYEDAPKVIFEDIQYRTDIGAQWSEWRNTLLGAGLLPIEALAW